MTWSTWQDEQHDAHVVENVDVPVMLIGQEPNPWHHYGYGTCPCQPSVSWMDPISHKRIVVHKDPVQ